MFLSMAQREKYLKGNRHIRQVPVAVAISGDHLMGVGPKVDGGFTENMQRIASLPINMQRIVTLPINMQ